MQPLEGQRAYLMLDQPSEYINQVLPQIIERTPRLTDIGDSERVNEVLTQLQEARWENQTGVSIADSKFTVILPVYNEEKALPSTLAALMISDIPKTVEAQFLFIVNASTDKSANILKQHLATIAPIEEVNIKSDIDAHLYPIAYRAKKGAVTFTLIETPTQTKANALNIGNEIAVKTGHKIAMNIDSDRYVEPGTIPTLFANAYNEFIKEHSQHHVLVDGTMLLARKKNLLSKILGGDIIVETGQQYMRLFSLFGATYSWDTEFLHSIGGTKQILIEDYGLALDSYMMGLIPKHTQARTWGYKTSSLFDVINERVRFYRGYLQLQDHWKDVPEALAAIAQNDEINYPFVTRTQRALSQLWERKFSPRQLAIHTAKMLFREYCMGIALIKHARYPKKKMWDKLQSTR